MHLVGRWLDPQDIVRGKLTALVGLFWLSGGLVVLLSVPWGPYPSESKPWILAIGLVGTVVGASLLGLRDRVLGRWFHAMAGVAGPVLLTLLIVLAGPDAAGTAVVLYVFVSSFAFIALPRMALVIVAFSAALHAGALWWMGVPGGPGRWVITWGAAVVTGMLAGEVVTAGRLAVAERDRLVAQLRDADVAKTAFLHAVRHELARPATAIAGLAETLDRRPELSEDQRRQLFERLVRRARSLTATLDGLLDFREVGEGAIDMTTEVVDLADIVDRALDLAEFDRDRLRIRDVEGRIVADGQKLAHAIANLLTNAAKYAPTDSVVDLSAELRPDLAIVRVEDRGPGIPDVMRWRIFEPFERADVEHEQEGTGLGLSIVRQFARLHGGDAWVEPREGGGSRFTITIATADPSGPSGPSGHTDPVATSDHADHARRPDMSRGPDRGDASTRSVNDASDA